MLRFLLVSSTKTRPRWALFMFPYSFEKVMEVLVSDFPNGLRIITINRKSALNALSEGIIVGLTNAIRDAEVKNMSLIILRGEGRAFCAGGDVRFLYEANQRGEYTAQEKFFCKEFNLDLRVASCPIPIISLLDGIVMGGGVGLTIHTPFRIGTENTVWAMPETAIGFFPDVSGSHFLPRLPAVNSDTIVDQSLGMYLGLSGGRLKGWECHWAGVVTHMLHSKDVAALVKEFQNAGWLNVDVIRSIIESFALTHKEQPVPIAQHAGVIRNIFSSPSLASILQRLQWHASSGNSFALHALSEIDKRSPFALALTYWMQSGGSLSYPRKVDSLVQHLVRAHDLEYRVACVIGELPQSDFVEGVRAALVEKRKPVWRQPTSDVERVVCEANKVRLLPLDDDLAARIYAD